MTGKSMKDLNKGKEQQFIKRNLFESQIKLQDMGDGEISPINSRKSYLLEKQKGKFKQTQKITEADPQIYVDKIKKDKEYEIYYDPYKDKKV